jgi:phospholipid/cholesterol/gamma-HCH transport system ATP-binding protein
MPIADNISTQEKVIAIRGLYKSFGENHVLRGVDLDVHKRENVVVLGKSGTGKSVLIKIIAGLLKADRGSVLVLGRDIETLSLKEIRQLRLKLGFSFQNSALYDSMTVRENLEFPLVQNNRNLKRHRGSWISTNH